MTEEQRTATLAAWSLSDAQAELQRFICEGPESEEFAFTEVDPSAKIIEALIRVAEIEISYKAGRAYHVEETEQFGQLVAACRKFLEDYVS